MLNTCLSHGTTKRLSATELWMLNGFHIQKCLSQCIRLLEAIFFLLCENGRKGKKKSMKNMTRRASAVEI